jgi:hypothetical protein
MHTTYTRTRRNSLGQFKRGRERMIHVSAHAQMIDNPAKAIATAAGKPFFGKELIPYVEKGTTFNAGRNAAKRIKSRAVAYALLEGADYAEGLA